MTKKKNQDPKTKESLSDIVRSEMIGKQQIPSILKDGNNFCISGLIINHFAPDIDIQYDAWSGITKLVNRYPKYFSEEGYSSYTYYGTNPIQKYVDDFKQYYQNTGRINLKILVSINDHSLASMDPFTKPFTFEDFANLFQEIGIKIEQLEPDINYKEDTVLSIDNVQLIEEDNKPTSFEPSFSNPFSNSNVIIQNMNVNLDPDVLNNIISKHVAEMLSKQRIGPTRVETRPSKNIIKTTEHKNV